MTSKITMIFSSFVFLLANAYSIPAPQKAQVVLPAGYYALSVRTSKTFSKENIVGGIANKKFITIEDQEFQKRWVQIKFSQNQDSIHIKKSITEVPETLYVSSRYLVSISEESGLAGMKVQTTIKNPIIRTKPSSPRGTITGVINISGEYTLTGNTSSKYYEVRVPKWNQMDRTGWISASNLKLIKAPKLQFSLNSKKYVGVYDYNLSDEDKMDYTLHISSIEPSVGNPMNIFFRYPTFHNVTTIDLNEIETGFVLDQSHIKLALKENKIQKIQKRAVVPGTLWYILEDINNNSSFSFSSSSESEVKGIEFNNIEHTDYACQDEGIVKVSMKKFNVIKKYTRFWYEESLCHYDIEFQTNNIVLRKKPIDYRPDDVCELPETFIYKINK